MKKIYKNIVVMAMILIIVLSANLRAIPAQEHYIAKRSLSLNNRHGDAFVNDVFKYNILHTVELMGNEFTLEPGQSFAFHEDVLGQYKGKVVKTTNAHFNAQEGFKFSGLYFGDGVCHLASLLYWAAKDAGLEAVAPVNHDFAQIPEIPAEHGVSIYSHDIQQNLYITNNKDRPVVFKFESTEGVLSIIIVYE